jgi:polyhydroxyalkanoate synthesis regulator phasin
MREGLSQVSSRVDRTNELLLETRSEMSSKLTGISDFLIQSEGSHNKSDKRLDSLETRVTKLENEKKRQP